MKPKNIAIAFSDSTSPVDAIKQLSVDIKSSIPTKNIDLALFFFTPHYNPRTLKEVLDITMHPKNIFAIQSPLISFQDKIVKKGIVMCCFAFDKLNLKEVFIKARDIDSSESILRKSLMTMGHPRQFSFISLPPLVNTNKYLRSAELTFGRGFKIFGPGFTKTYGTKNFQIINNIIDEGIGNMVLGGPLKIELKKINGFLPLGKTFTITKAIPERNVIMKINGKPASLIYKQYLEDKFDTFKRSSLGSAYPIGIRVGKEYKIVCITEFLNDGSLVCIGDLRGAKEGKIMMATPASLLEKVKEEAEKIKASGEYDVVIVINSLTRRKILGLEANKEIALLKSILGEKTNIIGLYSDYQMFPEKEMGKVSIENNHLCMVLLKHGNF